jgi:hypothetical protein
MGFFWIAALVLVVTGFTVLCLSRRSGDVLAGHLRSRGIDPAAWGTDLMGAGIMLSLGLWARSGVPWTGETVATRVALAAGAVWALASLGRAGVPLVRRGRPSPSLPVSGKGSRPPWLFLLLGWAIAIRLLWSVFHRVD